MHSKSLVVDETERVRGRLLLIAFSIPPIDLSHGATRSVRGSSIVIDPVCASGVRVPYIST